MGPLVRRAHVALRTWLARDHPSNWCVVPDGLRMDWESGRDARAFDDFLRHDIGVLPESPSVARSLVPVWMRWGFRQPCPHALEVRRAPSCGLAQRGLSLPAYASLRLSCPLCGGRALAGWTPAQCAELLPCCSSPCHKIPNSQGRDPRMLGGFAPPETARGRDPTTRRGFSPFLPSPSGYCSCVSCAMEVCCLSQAGGVPPPCSSLAGRGPMILVARAGGCCLVFGTEQLLSTSPPLTLSLHTDPALHCKVMDGYLALRLNCSYFRRMPSAGVAVLLALR